jgi:hypothetical protein
VSGLPATACSLSTAAAGEPAYGSAAPARTWVALEQPGPWGHDALAESHLEPALGRSLRAQVAGAGGRVALLRSARKHPDKRPRREPFVAIACAAQGSPWLISGHLESADALQELDFAALAQGDQDGVRASLPGLAPSGAPLLLVCTNGRRDVCCAVFGRPLAHDAAVQRPGQVWETSHTGGHRFSPTAVLLPWGVTLARLDARLAVATLDAAIEGELPRDILGPQHDRGRSSLAPPAQAAESAVRAQIGETVIEALTTTLRAGGDTMWEATVRHADGRSWPAVVRRSEPSGLRAPSCGKAPEPYSTYDVELAAASAASAVG